MAKKKRSAKQRANDKRLGQMAKKRAAAKRKSPTKKKSKRKTRTTTRVVQTTTGLSSSDLAMMRKIKNALSDPKTKSITIRK